MKINKNYLAWVLGVGFFIGIIYITITINNKKLLLSDFKDFNKEAKLKREQIELNLEPLIKITGIKQKAYTISELMKFLHVPGLSVAVFKDGHIDYQVSYGYADQSRKDPLTINTLLQAGSVSKPVAAAVAINSGYDLNADIRPKLKLMGLDDLYFSYPDSAISLKQILSHTAGFNVHGFEGYTDDRLPSLNQIINGITPANNEAIRVISKPGEKFSYSGGGYIVMELLLQQYKGQLFADLAQQIFNKLKMTHSTYEISKFGDGIAYAHNSLGEKITNNYNRYPEKSAAGLWTTPLDLAIFALDILAGLNNNNSKILTKNQTIEMLTNQTYANSTNGYALGFGVETSDKGKSIKSFDHGGVNNGFNSHLFVDVNTAQGYVIMVNSDNGMLLANIVGNTIAKTYGFASYKPPMTIAVKPKNEDQIDPLYLREYTVSYNSTESLKLFSENGELKIKLPTFKGGTMVVNLYKTSDNTYVNDWFDMIKIILDKNPDGSPIVRIFDEVAVVKPSVS